MFSYSEHAAQLIKSKVQCIFIWGVFSEEIFWDNCKPNPCLDLAMSANDWPVISSPILASQHSHCQVNLCECEFLGKAWIRFKSCNIPETSDKYIYVGSKFDLWWGLFILFEGCIISDIWLTGQIWLGIANRERIKLFSLIRKGCKEKNVKSLVFLVFNYPRWHPRWPPLGLV